MKNKVIDTASKYSRFLIIILLVVVLSLASSNFLTISNMTTIFRQSSLMLIMSLGMTCVMLLGIGVDMSIGSVLALSNCLAAPLMLASSSTGSVLLGVLVAIAVGVGVGIINGLLVAHLRLSAILVTFGMREILRGMVYLILQGKVIMNIHPAIQFIGSGRLFGEIPMPIIIAVVLAIIMAFVLGRTRIGREIYLVGANPSSANFSGVNSKNVIMRGFIFSGLFATIAGLIYLGRLGTAEGDIGTQFAFQVISAVAIGGISFSGGIGTIGGAVIGSVVLSTILNGMNLLNVSSLWQGIVNGLVILLAVLLDNFARKRLGQ